MVLYSKLHGFENGCSLDPYEMLNLEENIQYISFLCLYAEKMWRDERMMLTCYNDHKKETLLKMQPLSQNETNKWNEKQVQDCCPTDFRNRILILMLIWLLHKLMSKWTLMSCPVFLPLLHLRLFVLMIPPKRGCKISHEK